MVGRVDENLKTDDLAEFERIVTDWSKRLDSECPGTAHHAIYRGHRDHNWVIMASLFRNPDVQPQDRSGTDEEVEKWLLEQHLKADVAHRFERMLLRGFGRDGLLLPGFDTISDGTRGKREWQMLAIAQHYGLPTRLIDFTTNRLVALFFAVNGQAACRRTQQGREEQDSAVWCIKVPELRNVWEVWRKSQDDPWLTIEDLAKEGSDPPIEQFTKLAFIPVDASNHRIQKQEAVFMCEPRRKKTPWTLHATLQKQPTVLKVRVPHGFRGSLNEQLCRRGFSHDTLFPDTEQATRGARM